MLTTDFRFPGVRFEEFQKWRLTYNGGREFISTYLKKFDKLETTEEFATRSELTYCPSFAEEGIKEICDSIFPRMADITRTGGPPSYINAVAGLNGGVDLKFSTMDTFMGKTCLPEACALGKIGIYVDMPAFNPTDTLAQFQQEPHPYLYTYGAEQILSWRTLVWENELVFTSILVKDCNLEYDPKTGLPSGTSEAFRLIRLLDNGVSITFLRRYQDNVGSKEWKEEITKEVFIEGMTRIPLVIMDLGGSFLKNISDYQIVLLNIESSDIQYILKANFPFYVEQYNPLSEGAFQKAAKIDDQGNVTPTNAASTSSSGSPGVQEVVTGATKGRRYPMGADAPAFIHPSPEPLQASAAKQEQIKQDIRRLLNLAVSNVAPTRASAESKQVDQAGLEAGLAAIGIVMESTEQQVARIWCEYEKYKEKIVVKYPKVYSTKSDSQRIQDAKDVGELKTLAPSKQFNKELSKMAARAILAGKVTLEIMKKVEDEIDAAEFIANDYKEVASDVELGLVDKVTASNARGYDGAKVVPIATKEHTERLAEIAKAQSEKTNINGVKDTEPAPPAKRGDAK